MKELFVSYSSALGGAERLLLDLAGGAADSPALLCPPGPLAEEAAAAGLRVETLRARRLELRGSAADRAGAPLRIAAQGWEVRRELRRLEPEAVVAWSMRPLLACAAALARVRSRPALVFHHNDLLPGPVIGGAVRAAARSADRVICSSHAIARDLDPHGRLAGRIHVVHPGVDLDRFRPLDPPAGVPEVVLLGALTHWKRPQLALEIVGRAARRLPDLRLSVVGGPLTAAGEQLLRGLRDRADCPDLRGRVAFRGFLGDPRSALARSSCLLHCADREPFGMALVEALASARPVVAPRAAGPAEIVDTSCGRLYTPGDVEAGVEALLEVVGEAETAASLGAAGRRRAEQLFDLEYARTRYRELLATPASAGAG